MLRIQMGPTHVVGQSQGVARECLELVFLRLLSALGQTAAGGRRDGVGQNAMGTGQYYHDAGGKSKTAMFNPCGLGKPEEQGNTKHPNLSR